MKAIMYHYVRDYDERYPYFRYLPADEFKKQLDHFEKEFGFVSKEDLFNSIQTGVPADGVVLTFDDGLKEHYTHVLPELEKRNLWGIFYACTGMYRSKRLLGVHATHLLLGKAGGKKILDLLLNNMDEKMLQEETRESFRTDTYTSQNNDACTTEVKRILNYYMNEEAREIFLQQTVAGLLGNEEKIVEDFYLSTGEIKTMHDKGMIIGSHSTDHPVMSRLSAGAQSFQVEDSFSFLEKVTGGLSCKTFCYPYGGFHSFTPETETLLEKNKCLFSFNVEHRDISGDDLLNRRQALPRFDCNLFPHGQVNEI